MSDVCDFSIAVRVIDSSGTTLVDLNDHTRGLYVMRPIVPPSFSIRDIRVDSTRVDGSFRVAEALGDGYLPLRLTIRGATWAEVEQRWDSVYAVLMAESNFFVETEIEGVVRRYRTERPDSEPGDVETVALLNKRMEMRVIFRVQPNPTVSYS